MSSNIGKPDMTFFRLRCWRESDQERELVHKLYSTGLFTPRERASWAVYHSTTYQRLQASKALFTTFCQQLEQPLKIDTEAHTEFLILLENECAGTVRTAWLALDSLAHEINLVCWKQAGRKDLYHPYVQEKKISFYMVRQRLLLSAKLRNSPICQLLVQQTQDATHRSQHYILLSNLAVRASHRPLLLGCRWQQLAEDNRAYRILLTENEGMPREKAFSLHDVEIVTTLDDCLKWLTQFVDDVYFALSANL
ncbi:MAG: hypothetical protein AB1489_27560 [Acidobacteriota bacterium]